jgi:hypothetical protein
MRIAIALLLFSLYPASACAAFADFSEYMQSESFAPGELFQSGDLSFKALNWLAITNPVKVFATSFGEELNPGPGVEFLLPSGIQEAALRYNDGAGIAVAINGVEPMYPGHAGFSFLDGVSLGGISITTDLTFDGGSYEVGLLHLLGPINSLRLAGLELFVDDILVSVPEPTGAILSSLAILMLLHVISRRANEGGSQS